MRSLLAGRQLGEADIARYLHANNWIELDRYANGMRVFEEPNPPEDASPITAVVAPDNSPAFEEYAEKLLAILTFVEERPDEVIIREISQWDKERFSLRLLDPGPPTLANMAKAIPHLKSILAYGAEVETRWMNYYPTTTTVGNEFVKNECLFNHTERESFSINIDIVVTTQQSLVKRERPFGRKVVERLFHGLEGLSAEPLSDGGLNGNLCDEFAELARTLKGRPFEFRAHWSGEYGPPDGIIGRVLMTPVLLQRLKDRGEQMRQSGEGEITTLIGELTEIKRDPQRAVEGDDLEDVAIAKLYWRRPKSNPVRVEFEIHGDSAVETAFDAMRDGNLVSVTGKIIQPKRLYYLQEPRDFHVVGSLNL